MLRLESITLKGFKSFDQKDTNTIDLGKTTVLIGANGTGKSNLLSVFKFLNSILTGGMQSFVRRSGPSSLFFCGPKRTPNIELRFQLKDGGEAHSYTLQFGFGNPDCLVLLDERIDGSALPLSGNGEASLWSDHADPMRKTVFDALSDVRFYQFHDTSDGASIKLPSALRNRNLKADGGNLSAILYHLKSEHPKHYERIRRHIGAVMPQFDDFVLEPENDTLLLNWKARGDVDGIYGPHQISDGSLRFMALATLLLQPPESMPGVIAIDEPELGLHPAAIVELAGMMRTASRTAKVIVATQSPLLMNEFEPEDLVIVERDEASQSTVCRRLDAAKLGAWLREYSLGDLWEKNLLGGRP